MVGLPTALQNAHLKDTRVVVLGAMCPLSVCDILKARINNSTMKCNCAPGWDVRWVLQAANHELYWSVGDGGPQNDPFGNAQDKTLLHGSIIRILVPSAVAATGYTIPAGNAFDGLNGEWPPADLFAPRYRLPLRGSRPTVEVQHILRMF